MGEYAKRRTDGQEVKIGTCEDMYYLRYEDRAKVSRLQGNVDPARDAEGLRFRLPFPDEDHLQPGDYDEYNRYLRLYKRETCAWCKGDPKGYMGGSCPHCHDSGKEPSHVDYESPELVNRPGTIQLRHESGLLLNVPCYHGIKLPEVTKPMQAFWNGKNPSLVLSSLRVADGKLWPVLRCCHCNEAWRCDWSDLWDYIPADMQQRLRAYKEQHETVTA